MKKVAVIMILLVVIVSIFLLLPLRKTEGTNNDFLRIHIRANSNDYIDQSVKYKVKEEVVKLLTPYIANCKSKQDAKSIIESRLDEIEQCADRVLRQNNFTYSSTARSLNEYFPTRSYDGHVVESGYYDALIVYLGEAKGDNWWCVVYPPLCFVDTSNNVVYKSKIIEIINKFFGNK